jgi:hypothetical protein
MRIPSKLNKKIRCQYFVLFGLGTLGSQLKADDFEVELSVDLGMQLDHHFVGTSAVNVWDSDITALDGLLGGRFNGISHIAIGHSAEQHVIATGLLLDDEAADGGEGGSEGFRFSLEGGLALRFLGPSVLDLAKNGSCHRDSLSGGHQKITGVTGGYIDEVPVFAKAQYIFTENNLYALGHDDET